jgi:hypothetical protein
MTCATRSLSREHPGDELLRLLRRDIAEQLVARAGIEQQPVDQLELRRGVRLAHRGEGDDRPHPSGVADRETVCGRSPAGPAVHSDAVEVKPVQERGQEVGLGVDTGIPTEGRVHVARPGDEHRGEGVLRQEPRHEGCRVDAAGTAVEYQHRGTDAHDGVLDPSERRGGDG